MSKPADPNQRICYLCGQSVRQYKIDGNLMAGCMGCGLYAQPGNDPVQSWDEWDKLGLYFPPILRLRPGDPIKLRDVPEQLTVSEINRPLVLCYVRIDHVANPPQWLTDRIDPVSQRVVAVYPEHIVAWPWMLPTPATKEDAHD